MSPTSSSCASTNDVKLSEDDSERGVRGLGPLAVKATELYASDAGHRFVESDADIRARAGNCPFELIAHPREPLLQVGEIGGAECIGQAAERVERVVDRDQRELAAAAGLFRFLAAGVRFARDQRADSAIVSQLAGESSAGVMYIS